LGLFITRTKKWIPDERKDEVQIGIKMNRSLKLGNTPILKKLKIALKDFFTDLLRNIPEKG